MKNLMWRAVPPRQGTKRSAIGDRTGSSRVPLDTGLSRLGRSSHTGYRIRVHPIAIKTLRIQFMSPRKSLNNRLKLTAAPVHLACKPHKTLTR